MKKDKNTKKEYTENIVSEAKEDSSKATENDVAASSEKTSKSVKKTVKKVLLVILIILVAAVTALCIRYWHVLRLVVNWENISAYRNSQKYTREELEEKMEENNSKIEKVVEENPDVTLRTQPQLTEEESKALKEGLITYDDAIKLVLDQKTLDELLEENTPEKDAPDKEEPDESKKPAETVKPDKKPSSQTGSASLNTSTGTNKTDKPDLGTSSAKPGKHQSGNNSQTANRPSSNTSSQSGNREPDSSGSSSSNGTSSSESTSTNKTPQNNASQNSGQSSEGSGNTNREPSQSQPGDRASEIVAELYVVQADFMSRLEAIGDSAYADYKATRYDRSQIMTIVDGYTATVGALEAECDKKVNTLIKELNAELDKIGGDKSLAKDIKKYYYTEKSLKKSYYLDRLNDEDYK